LVCGHAFNQGLGQTFAEAIGAAVERIAQDPAALPFVYGAVRRLVVRRFPYAVYFREVDDEIVVLAIPYKQWCAKKPSAHRWPHPSCAAVFVTASLGEAARIGCGWRHGLHLCPKAPPTLIRPGPIKGARHRRPGFAGCSLSHSAD